MGFYRFVLAVFVLLFHCGLVTGAPGASVVFGFYMLSGYLAPLAFEKKHGTTFGVIHYLINRGKLSQQSRL